MTLISLPVPSVVEGLTEKPPHLSDPGKFKTLTNFLPLGESGLTQRHGTRWLKKIDDGTTPLSLRPMDIGGDDKYLIALGHKRIKAYYRNGTEVPVFSVDRDASGTITGGFDPHLSTSADPDLSYLDLYTPQGVGDADSLRVAGGAWTASGDAQATSVGNGPLKPQGFPDPPSGLDVQNYSELLHAATGGTATWSDSFNNYFWQGISKLSVYVNTEIDAGATRVSNSNRIRVWIGAVDGGSSEFGVEFDFDSGFTSPPSVYTNDGPVLPVIEQISTNEFRLGFIVDGSKMTASGGELNTTQVNISLDDGTATSGMYAGDVLYEREGDKELLGKFAQDPEVIKSTVVGNKMYLANPLIATRADRTNVSSTFTEVYGTRTFTNDTTAPPAGNGHAAGSNETGVTIADAAYTYVRTGAQNTTYGVEIVLTDTTGSNPSSPVTLTYAYTTTSGVVATEDDTDVIATALRDGLVILAGNTDGGTGGNEARIIEGEVLSNESVIKWETKLKDGETWVITSIRSYDGLGSAATFSWHDTTTLSAELPLVAQDDTRVILAEPTDDDLTEVPPQVILRFVGDDAGTFGPGYWKEGVDYGLDLGFDATTLPHALIRRVDDTAGTVTGKGGTVYFEWAEHDWDDRLVGDDTTNDYPSFITPEVDEGIDDRYVTAVGHFQDRLLLCSGGRVNLSSVGRDGVFFRTTIQSLPDSERIDVVSSAPTASAYFDAPSAGGIQYLRAKRTLDRLTFSGALSPKTVGIQTVFFGPSSDVSMATQVYDGLAFAARSQRSDFVRFLSNPTTDQGVQEFNLSEDIPKLPGFDISSVAWSPDVQTLFIHGRRRPTQVLGCRFILEGRNTKQRAWFKMAFNDQVVDSLAVLEDDLFLVVQRSDGQHLEHLPLSVAMVDRDAGDNSQSEDWAVRLDRRITEGDLDTAMSFAAGATTITLPYDMVDASLFEVVHRDGDDFGVPLTINSTSTATPGAHTIVVSGDVTGDKLFIGETFSSVATPLRPTLGQSTRQGRLPAASTRVLIRSVDLAVVDTAYLDILIKDLVAGTTIPTSEGTYPLIDGESTTAVTLKTETATASVGGRPEDTDVEIRNSSHKPTLISALEWKLEIADRGGRIPL